MKYKMFIVKAYLVRPRPGRRQGWGRGVESYRCAGADSRGLWSSAIACTYAFWNLIASAYLVVGKKVVRTIV